MAGTLIRRSESARLLISSFENLDRSSSVEIPSTANCTAVALGVGNPHLVCILEECRSLSCSKDHCRSRLGLINCLIYVFETRIYRFTQVSELLLYIRSKQSAIIRRGSELYNSRLSFNSHGSFVNQTQHSVLEHAVLTQTYVVLVVHTANLMTPKDFISTFEIPHRRKIILELVGHSRDSPSPSQRCL